MIRQSFLICSVLALVGLLTACASSNSGNPPATVDVQQVGSTTFGTTNFVTHEVMDSTGTATLLGSTGEEYALLAAIQQATQSQSKLLVWGRSSSVTAGVIQRTFDRFVALSIKPADMAKLQLLFVGTAADAQQIKGKVEASGAHFLFYAQP